MSLADRIETLKAERSSPPCKVGIALQSLSDEDRGAFEEALHAIPTTGGNTPGRITYGDLVSILEEETGVTVSKPSLAVHRKGRCCGGS